MCARHSFSSRHNCRQCTVPIPDHMGPEQKHIIIYGIYCIYKLLQASVRFYRPLFAAVPCHHIQKKKKISSVMHILQRQCIIYKKLQQSQNIQNIIIDYSVHNIDIYILYIYKHHTVHVCAYIRHQKEQRRRRRKRSRENKQGIPLCHIPDNLYFYVTDCTLTRTLHTIIYRCISKTAATTTATFIMSTNNGAYQCYNMPGALLVCAKYKQNKNVLRAQSIYALRVYTHKCTQYVYKIHKR